MSLESLTIAEYKEMTKRYVVTSAQYGAIPNKNFLKGLDKYCSVNDAELLILPMRGKSLDDDRLHPDLQHYKIIEKEYRINKNIRLRNYGIRPNQIEPTTGLLRMAQHESTTIIPSPKQRMRVVPNSNVDLPKVLMSTGAVTHPSYNTRDDPTLSFNINERALEDHKYGAIVVEKLNGTRYHYRQIDALKNGKFCDLGVLYNGNSKPKKAAVGALVLGDLHGVSIDSRAHKANLEQIELLKPKYLVIHDLFDGATINHWEEGKEYAKFDSFKTYGNDLGKELYKTATLLNQYAVAMKHGEVIVVKSNHDERIDRWLEESRYIKEPQNNLLGHQLFLAKHDGHDPLEYGLNLQTMVAPNVKFLSRDEDFKLRGFQLGNHGDLGANGGKGSSRSKEYANGKSITGHTHTPEILRDTYVVGTSTPLKMPYTKGFSSWMQTNGILYDIGKVQLINSMRGAWRLK